MGHVLVGVELVVQVVAVQDQNPLQCLQLEGEATAKSLRADADIVSDVARNLRDERIVDLSVRKRDALH